MLSQTSKATLKADLKAALATPGSTTLTLNWGVILAFLQEVIAFLQQEFPSPAPTPTPIPSPTTGPSITQKP
jgi:hypothetical protein